MAALGFGPRGRHGQLSLDLALAHSADHRDASASFIIQSVDISYGRGLQIKPPPGFADFTNIRVLRRPRARDPDGAVRARRGGRASPHGLGPLGAGDRAEHPRGAARRDQGRAGALLTYALCGALGGLDGALLAGYFRGANVDIGDEYLLASIAVVVIGGTSVTGGKANLPGVWGAALFLVLLLTMLNTFGVSAGVRLLATGLIIVAVITAAGGEKKAR